MLYHNARVLVGMILLNWMEEEDEDEEKKKILHHPIPYHPAPFNELTKQITFEPVLAAGAEIAHRLGSRYLVQPRFSSVGIIWTIRDKGKGQLLGFRESQDLTLKPRHPASS